MANASPFELALLALINGEREAAGLEPLTLNTLLNDAAEAHSQWMLEEDQFSHEGENGSSPGDRMEEAGYPFEGRSLSAENIGWQSLRGEDGFEDDVAQVHEALMNSPGHRANILNPDAEDVGLGVEIGTFTGATGDYEAVMVTQVFAATDADVSAWTDPGTGEPEEDPVDETPDDVEPPVTDDMPDETPEDVDPPVAEETPDEDPEVTDPPVAEETPEETDPPVDEETPEETDPPVIAEETPDAETPDQDEDDPIMVDCPIDEDVAMDDDTPVSDPTPSLSPEVFLSCGMTNFTVDLSEAFEFRQDGDQLIWETSEERLFDAFMKSFDTWMADMEQMEDTEQSEDLLADLMTDDPSEPMMNMLDDEMDPANDWLLSDCA